MAKPDNSDDDYGDEDDDDSSSSSDIQPSQVTARTLNFLQWCKWEWKGFH